MASEKRMIGDRKILAVVTARANSQGLPGKNYMPLLGRPLVQWSMLAALKSNYIDDIIVSSNCEHVREATEAFINEFYTSKVRFVQRPESLATSLSKNEEALIHAVEKYEERQNNSPFYVVNLQPTSPIRHHDLIDRCIKMAFSKNVNSLLTVQACTPFFVQKTEKGLIWHYDPDKRPMRQSLSASQIYYHDDGCLYLMTVDHLYNSLNRIDINSVELFENYPYCSLQIDTVEDFNVVAKIKKELDETGHYI
ncbi:MAG: acylneuraminate cytidylyltransferase family protein [Candidatus Competibacteraceae bacterium]|nr:acylneuraminate cytidylyltransferase family protein [Candidatus Competibacteraceae bacterium]